MVPDHLVFFMDPNRCIGCEACVHACKLAIDFREQFKCDVMIDLWCYRRHGHNETDEPAFTQPVMYREIEQHQSAREQHAARLIAEGVATAEELEEMKAELHRRFAAALPQAKEYRPRLRRYIGHQHEAGLQRLPAHRHQDTGS